MQFCEIHKWSVWSFVDFLFPEIKWEVQEIRIFMQQNLSLCEE